MPERSRSRSAARRSTRRADGQHLGDQAGPFEFVDDDAGGPIFGVTDLGIVVQIAADPINCR
jgi:hypothetical protein